MATERGLSVGEIQLCSMIFRETIPTGMVRVVERPKVAHGGFTPFEKIRVDPETYRTDFVGNVIHPFDPSDARFFLHELAHVWQYFVGLRKISMFFEAARAGRRRMRQLGKKGTIMSYNWQAAVYSYEIRPGMDLMDFNLEQQCDIIEDYFAWTLWSDGPRPWGDPWPKPPTVQQLVDVLLRFHQDPSYPSLESSGNSRRAARRA